MREIEVDGLRITYERAGTGPPLVLLHGYVGDGPATWRPQLDGLSDDFTLVAWNAPGAGGSSDPPESFGMACYADTLAGFIAALGLHAPNVAGISFGGALALELYRRHPSVPSALVLASAYAGWGGSLPAEVASQRLRQAHVLADLSPDEFAGALLPTMFSEGTPRESVEAFGASMRGFHPAGFRAMANASAEDLRDVLPHIEVPTLLVYGVQHGGPVVPPRAPSRWTGAEAGTILSPMTEPTPRCPTCGSLLAAHDQRSLLASGDRLTPWMLHDLPRIAWIVEYRAGELTDEERQIVRDATARMLRALEFDSV